MFSCKLFGHKAALLTWVIQRCETSLVFLFSSAFNSMPRQLRQRNDAPCPPFGNIHEEHSRRKISCAACWVIWSWEKEQSGNSWRWSTIQPVFRFVHVPVLHVDREIFRYISVIGWPQYLSSYFEETILQLFSAVLLIFIYIYDMYINKMYIYLYTWILTFQVNKVFHGISYIL